ncbi:PREDICTED: uncharacterized protein LOC105564065 [Vollenhovia emeryi]|uniref:uncharacterized protein LOC105564065 n=1 Tax=Vollenhovia emeryi TaxID=411798 RepID=UPI0005F52383|nr:PREDICTED: uncharacterized protein LOC105564065 [Vollenhovia emeryi]
MLVGAKYRTMAICEYGYGYTFGIISPGSSDAERRAEVYNRGFHDLVWISSGSAAHGLFNNNGTARYSTSADTRSRVKIVHRVNARAILLLGVCSRDALTQ